MQTAMLIEHMHWDYDTYLDQPQWLIDTLRIKLSEDGIHQAQQNKPK